MCLCYHVELFRSIKKFFLFVVISVLVLRTPFLNAMSLQFVRHENMSCSSYIKNCKVTLKSVNLDLKFSDKNLQKMSAVDYLQLLRSYFALLIKNTLTYER